MHGKKHEIIGIRNEKEKEASCFYLLFNLTPEFRISVL
jgi:hypothetical protein